jgi:glycosyltransferase involved in cell wall biosynthesis
MESNPECKSALCVADGKEKADVGISEVVTAVMITGKHPGRRQLARAALTSFLAQTYREKEMLIINTGEPLRPPEPYIREICLEQGALTLGDLRNLGIEEARGAWVIQWDDDDWHHPERITVQMEFAGHDAACVLGSQIRCSLVKQYAFVRRREEGIEGTILHPRSTSIRYPSLAKREDTAFYRAFPEKVIIFDRPELYVRFYHGNNTWDEKHLMRGTRKNRGIDPELAFLLNQVVLPYYRSTNKSAAGDSRQVVG